MKEYHSEITNTHIVIVIVVLIAITAFYYESKHTCPRCKEKFKTKRLYKLEQGDILMPHPYNVLERFKCQNCGNVWDEFSQESTGD